MRSRGIWLTVLMRGVQLNSLTPSNGGTTAPISYTQCYKSGGGVTSGTMPYTGGAPPMLWTPPPLAYNGLQTCEGKDLEVIIFNLKQISNEKQIFN